MRISIAALTIGAFLAFAGEAKAIDLLWSWEFSDTNDNNGHGPDTAGGTLITTDSSYGPILSISGVFNSAVDGSDSIGGLLPIGSVGANDNIAMPYTSYINNAGFSFFTPDGLYVNIYQNWDVINNVLTLLGTYGDYVAGPWPTLPSQPFPTNIPVYNSDANGTFTMTLIGPVPEPVSIALFGTGLAGLGLAMRSRRRLRA